MTFEEWRAKAEQGSVVAAGVIGMDYLFGTDAVVPNHAEALRWLTVAAAAGASRPTVWLGTMYEQGLAVAVDPDKARELYQFGAEREELHGCIFLARLLLSGRAGTIDEPGALRWYRAALAIPNLVECEELEEARRFVADRA